MGIDQQIRKLQEKFHALNGIEFNQYNELLAVDINNDSAEATIFLQGAQISKYQPKGQAPVLWLSEYCEFRKGSPLRGGIPICWPWFSEFERNPEAIKKQYNGSQPAHGFVRKLEWSLDSISSPNKSITVLKFSLNIAPNEDFPFRVQLELYVSVGTTLEIEFRVLNTDTKNFCFTSALHSYFNISETSNTSVTGLEGINYLDTLDNWCTKTEPYKFVFDDEVDRVYQNVPNEVRLIDSVYERTLSITNTHSPDMVVWNPWIEKSKHLSQFDSKDYKKMICLESANLLDNLCELSPGDSYRTRIIIRSSELV